MKPTISLQRRYLPRILPPDGAPAARNNLVNGGTLHFLALYVSSIIESLNFLGPGC